MATVEYKKEKFIATSPPLKSTTVLRRLKELRHLNIFPGYFEIIELEYIYLLVFSRRKDLPNSIT